jgi:S-adenosylmethionine:tRNA ribosyltransferase-isomerase
MNIADFNYNLPEELIAQEPLATRDASRMLVLDRQKRSWIDSRFSLIADYLNLRDVVVINNTEVFPARLMAQREKSGGHVEVLLLKEMEPLCWEALIRPGRRLKTGSKLVFENSRAVAEITDGPGKDVRHLQFESEEVFKRTINDFGQVPLPPYIKRPIGPSGEDKSRYQTIFAHERGAIAAPTAGLHFTAQTIESLKARGVQVVEITLHVGYGTFEPVRVEQVEDHQVRPEVVRISEHAAGLINSCKADGGRVLAVGTTTTRALESATDKNDRVIPINSEASLTITPGYRFRVVDALLTNFHLPCSSLLLLVSAFASRELILSAYEHAVQSRYRFYSYGDCMLII